MQFFNILKGKGPKGKSWTKGPDGKRIYADAGGAKPAVGSAPNSSVANVSPSKSAFPVKTFDQVGETYGATKLSPTMAQHTSKDNAIGHASFISGHLEDSGYKQVATHNENNIHTQEFAHPDGSKVMLNQGVAGGNHFVGYHHEEGTSSPSEEAKPTASKPTAANPPTSTAHTGVQAWGSNAGYDREDLKGSGSVHTLRTAGFAGGMQALKQESDLHTHLLKNGFKQVGETFKDANNKSKSSQFEHPDGTVVNSVTAYNTNAATGHTFAVTPPRQGGVTATTKPKAVGVTGKTLLKTSALKKLAKLTDDNDHSGAVLHAAKMLGHKDFIERAQKIKDDHMKQGSLSQDNYTARTALSKDIMDHAKTNLHPSDYDKFYGAF